MNVRLTEEQKIKILNSEDLYKIMQQILLRQNKIRRSQEYFWAVGLDNKNTILFVELISIGRSNRVYISPPDVFRMGIYKLATSMIMVHNHPSGKTDASDEDKQLTDRLLKAAKIIEIDVIDHLIITEKEYFSFADAGLIKDFEINSLLELVDKEKEEIKALKVEVETEKVKKEEAMEIAKQLKRNGVDEKIIAESTGLSFEEVQNLKGRKK
jgi:DNA repair protein RadC